MSYNQAVENTSKNLAWAHIVCLMYKLITSARNTDDLSIGFDRDREKRKKKN